MTNTCDVIHLFSKGTYDKVPNQGPNVQWEGHVLSISIPTVGGVGISICYVIREN